MDLNDIIKIVILVFLIVVSIKFYINRLIYLRLTEDDYNVLEVLNNHISNKKNNVQKSSKINRISSLSGYRYWQYYQDIYMSPCNELKNYYQIEFMVHNPFGIIVDKPKQ